MVQASALAGKSLVVRVDDATVDDDRATLIDDLHILAERHLHPIVVAPNADAARSLVRTMNRSTNIAVALSGSDAALLPKGPSGIGRVQTRILETLATAGFIPVVEPTAFAIFDSTDADVVADDVAAAIASACGATSAIFFHAAGGVTDPETSSLIAELTPAEALSLADDHRLPDDLRGAIRAAALGVRAGVHHAQIVDGRVSHAIVVEMLTTQHVGTRVTGGLLLAG